MHNSQRSDSAVFFDLDGLFFHPRAHWKALDPHLARLGERVHWKEALAAFRHLRWRAEPVSLTNFFGIDEIALSLQGPEQQRSLSATERLLRAAHGHKSNGRHLYLISACPFRELLDVIELWMPRPRRYPLLENPFQQAGFITVSLPPAPPGFSDADAERAGYVDRSVAARPRFDPEELANPSRRSQLRRRKLVRMASLLRYKRDGDAPRDPTAVGGVYDRLQLYHTEADYAHEIEELCAREAAHWRDRNALYAEFIDPLETVTIQRSV
ncbi:MAG: hypothetical protein K1X75_12435 [Leptospirales bacterium]|nr:hypothetical protein [Leptospirales bacterium]